MEDKIQPELSDIIESLHRYLAVHKNNACFVLNFVAFKEGNEKCVDCGEPIEEINDEGSRVFLYGNKETLRLMLNELRDIVEDEVDENDFVNI